MKGLLHSKTFQRKLYKWLFMYVGILLLLTTVITYSKYISRLMSSDTARPAKFDISVVPNNCTDEESDGVHCNIGKYRPTGNIDYYFTLKSDSEVKTDIFLTIALNKRFKLVSIKEIDGEDINFDSYDSDTDTKGRQTGERYNVSSFKALTAQAGKHFEKKYQVTVKYNNLYCANGIGCTTETEDYSAVQTSIYDILRVDFSAIQVAK